jgi:hypothetical protein
MVGSRFCARHGGKFGYHKVLGKGNLATVYANYLSRPSNLDLSEELALQRTMLANILEQVKDANLGNIKATVTGVVMEMTSIIAKTIKIMSEVESSVKESVHVEDIKMVCDSIIQILNEAGIEDDKLFEIAAKLENLALPVFTGGDDVTDTEQGDEETEVDS